MIDENTKSPRPQKTKYYNPETDLYSLRLDEVFKYAFGTVQNKRFTISFLNDVYGDNLSSPIVDVDFEDKEIYKDDPMHKKGYIDILCKSQSGEKFIIEMQNGDEKVFHLRALYYLVSIYMSQYNKAGNAKPLDHNMHYLYIY